eukprot:TRINITY_DN220_c0_g1_i1.p1 TRINITY_DN220_c0_g1~~TRINITY_DN220_c0_g1_i1.p1  ORF type:complete len:777 (-),score=145.31 TRINITY_DN220_c0_g1_i1:4513-6843(-)
MRSSSTMSSVSSMPSSCAEPNTPVLDSDEPLSMGAVVARHLPHEARTTRFVKAAVLEPRRTLRDAVARTDFLRAVLGEPTLMEEANTDAALLRQLQTRAAIVCRQVADGVHGAQHFELDAFVALLALMATRWPLLLDVMEAESVSLVVLGVLQRSAERVSIVARCLTALRAFSVTDAMRRRVMFDGAIPLTLRLMRQHANSRRIQDRALALIANISFGCAHRKRVITRQGAIPAIIQAMTTFANDQNIQLRSALAIRNLTHQTQVNQYIAGNEGAVEAIASAMLRFRGSNVNPELRFQCIIALESLCHEHERNRQRLTDVDASPLSFPTTLCSSSSAELWKPSHVDDTHEIVNEDGDIVVEEEEVLVSDITPHFRHGAALRPGKLVSNLIASPSVSSSGYSDRAAPTSPVSNRDQSPPEKHREAIEKEEQPSIKKPSIIRAIIHAMRRDPDDAMLLETSLSVLTLIALNNVQVQHKIGLFGGIQVAVAAIKRHPKHAAVATKSCALIRCLCLQEANRRLITSGLPVLISALNEHRAVPDVVREVAAALSNAVFENEKNRAWVVNKGGVQAIIQAMDDCGAKDVMVLDAGICAMRNFVDSSYSGALSAVNDGAVHAAVSALDRTKDASTRGECIVQEQAVMFLVDVASLAPQAKKHMRDADAADWIENALAKLSAERYAELHAAADSLISELVDQGTNIYGKTRTASAASQRGNAKPFGRPPRGLFGGFLLPRRAATTIDTRKRFGGRSMPLGAERNEIPRKTKRFSARLRFGTALS